LEPINGLPILANMHNIFSNLIDYHFKQERITEDQINAATKFIDRLENIIFVRKGIVVKLEPFGSLKSGFGTRNSDIDLCISFSKNKLETEVELVRSF
jgi:DNA polymerase sigma